MSAAAETAEEPVLLRYIAKFEDGARRPPVAQLYYKDTDEGRQKAEEFVRREDAKGYSIYSCIGLLRCMPRNKENVGALPHLVLDIDLRSVEETRERVIECLRELALPPSEIRDSGRGVHPVWLLKEPLTDDAGMAQAEHTMKRMAALLAADPEPTHRAALLRHLGVAQLEG